MSAPDTSVWAKAQDILKKEADNEQTFNIWFSPIKCASLSADTITLEVPNEFFKGWILDRYVDVLTFAVQRASGAELKIEFVLGEEDPTAAAHPVGQDAPRKGSKKETKGFWPFSRQYSSYSRCNFRWRCGCSTR